jgi:hypothetical protein
MSTDRWRRVEELYHEALRRDASQRATFLSEACADDEALLREVESLLRHEGSAAGFLAAPALEVSAKIMSEEPAAFFAGRRFGSYTIHSAPGAGGMGEVYRARDSRPGTPRGLFAARVGGPFGLKYRQQYVVSPDGQSFVLHSVVGETDTSPITVILNWKPKR